MVVIREKRWAVIELDLPTGRREMTKRGRGRLEVDRTVGIWSMRRPEALGRD